MDDNQREKKEKQKLETMSVLEVKRIHDGYVTVVGTIVSLSEQYVVISRMQTQCTNTECLVMHDEKHDPPVPTIIAQFDPGNGRPLICPKCKSGGFRVKFDTRNARFVQLEDIEKPDANERQDVILYDRMTEDLIAGEVVEITGKMFVQRKSENLRSKRLMNVVHANSIKYLNRRDVVITKNDIKTFYKFLEFPNLIPRLVSMFCPNIIGHDDAKLGLLRSIVGGLTDKEQKYDGRISTLIVGDPGTAKSTLTRESIELKANSRYVSAPHASSKTITAIIEKMNDTIVISLGAIPLSRGALCGINEITAFSMEDQGRLLDILEEGTFPVDKHGRHITVPSPTTIVATANPIHSNWNNRQLASDDEIAIKKTLLDRFSQKFVFRNNMSSVETQLFTKKMNDIRKRKPHNYRFLTKYLLYASKLKPKIDDEAEYMLNRFWMEGKLNGLFNMRDYRSIFRIAEAEAKLQLKEAIDGEVATHAMESIRMMMVNFGETVSNVKNPRDVVIESMLQILQNSEIGFTIYELCKLACNENKQIAGYLGYNWYKENNMKLRPIIDALLNHSNVKKISLRPIVLRWVSDVADVTDADPMRITNTLTLQSAKINDKCKDNYTDKNASIVNIKSATSDISDGLGTLDRYLYSGQKHKPIVKLFSCPYSQCAVRNIYQEEIDLHIRYSHTDYAISAIHKSNLSYTKQVLHNHLSKLSRA